MSLDTSKSDEYALLQLTPVQGYEPFRSYETFLRIVDLNATHFIASGSNKVAIYSIIDSTTVKAQAYTLPQGVMSTLTEVVDATSDKNNLYLLDSSKGLFVLPLITLDSYQQFDLPYGRSIKM
jgi:hypothetical protein